jgi:hypothetical protein
MDGRGTRRVLVSIAAAALVLTQTVSARAFSGGGFIVLCNYSHTLPDDPIVYPNQPGASHSHDFFGNTSTNAFSTYSTMATATTNCRLPLDTAGYWAPTPALAGLPFHAQGRAGDMRIYYIQGGASSVQTIPAGLKEIGGNSKATAPVPLWEVRWYCSQNSDVTTPVRNHPYDCTPYARKYSFVDGVIGWVNLPRCWDGTGVGPADVKYPTGGSGVTCPSGFGHLLPLVSERIHFGIMDPCNGAKPCGPDDPPTNVALSFSSGPYYTFHVDFWNTWDQPAMNSLVANCINAGLDCDQPQELQVTKTGTGSGRVTSSPSGIDCGSVCYDAFGYGFSVKLTATPDPGSSFAGWTGACSGTGTCSVTMNKMQSVTATFSV